MELIGCMTEGGSVGFCSECKLGPSYQTTSDYCMRALQEYNRKRIYVED